MDGDWCGNPECLYGPNPEEQPSEKEPVAPKQAPDGMVSHGELAEDS
jgi:hypothetical protein